MPSQSTHKLSVATRGRGFYECTSEVARWVASLEPRGAGLLTLFIQHTSASLLIQENADPDVQVDMETRRTAPFRPETTARLAELHATHRLIPRPAALTRPFGLGRAAATPR